MRTSVLVSFFLVGCEYLPAPAGTSTASVSSSSTASTGATSVAATTPDDGPAGPVSPWSVSFHPCFGNRTDTLWFDDRDNVWVGCGSTTEGTGLYKSEDGGWSWITFTGYFETFRVSSISRSDDGLLYVAGIDTVGSHRVVSLDDELQVASVFSAGGQVWNTFQVGTFRRNGAGLAVAESLTGTGLVSRFDDAEPWADGSAWAGTGSYQILDLVLHDDEFYGVGSTISQPPYVYLPPEEGQDEAQGFRLVPVQIDDHDGELWGLDVDAGGVVAAGVDQDRDAGVVYVSGPDPYDFPAWSTLDVGVFTSEPTWMRGACRDGDTLVAVGEYSREGTALVLRSDDAGVTWDDVTPYDLDLPSLHRCEVFPDGDVVIAGAEGVVLTFCPHGSHE